MVGVRKSLDLIFTKDELRILDDILPSFKRHEKLDDEDRKSLHSEGGQLRVTMANGNVMTIPYGDEENIGLNITEELTRSGVWKSLAGNGSTRRRNKSEQELEEEIPSEEGIELNLNVTKP